MDLGISGRRAAVAAGSSGLGLGAARAVAGRGCPRRDLRPRSGPDSIAPAADLDGAVSTFVCDVGSAEGGAEFVELATDVLGGGIDILVPNAGGPPAGDFESTDVDAYGVALDLNLVSIVAMCKAAVPAMQQRGWGRVVAITSLSVRQPVPDLILSNTARAGGDGLLEDRGTRGRRTTA